jgi:hypothetical protein
MKHLFALLIAPLIICSSPALGFSVQDGLSREFTFISGQHHDGVLEILNDSNEDEVLRLFQTDYLFYADGTNEYGKPGSVERSNSHWIKFMPVDIMVPAHGTAFVNYTIDVPSSENLTGSYWSMLIIEPVLDDGPEISSGIGIRTVIRKAVQFVTTIEGTGTSNIEIEGSLNNIDDNIVLQINISNSGDLWLRPDIWAEIYNSDGALVERIDNQKKRIYPSCSVSQQFKLNYPSGKYSAMIIIDNGGDDVWGSQYQFELP